jgi:hypothetical protein
MPQRETVAGDATRRSMGSNIMLIKSFIAMISPDMRQSFLLSSSTWREKRNVEHTCEKINGNNACAFSVLYWCFIVCRTRQRQRWSC